MRWKQYISGLCGFLFGFWMCMPRDIQLMPRYEVLVQDAGSKGLPFAQVEQLRQDYAISGATSFSFSTADVYGRAAFPAVSGRTSPLFRILFCGRRKAARGLAAPCGYMHQFTIEVPGYTEVSRSESDLPLQSRGRLVRVTMKTFPSRNPPS